MIKRFSYIVETLLFTIIILGISYVNGNPAYLDVHFHPFYFVILLIASRYGYAKSLFAALIVGGVYLLFYFVGLGSIDFTDIWMNCYQPVTYLAFAMFVGLLIEVDKKKINVLNGNISDIKETLQAKQRDMDQVISLNINLSEKLTVTDKTFNIVFRETKGFYNKDIMSVYEAAYGVLSKLIKSTKAFIFYLDKNEFKLACPKEALEESKKFLKHNEERIEKVRRSHECLRLDSDRDHHPTERAPLLIGPILHHETDTLYGFLVIEEMDFLTYNENTYLTFKNLCKWLGDVFYFRLSIHQSPLVSVDNIDSDFKFLIGYGAPREKIRGLVEGFLSSGNNRVASEIGNKP